jgi:hypothetical protein
MSLGSGHLSTGRCIIRNAAATFGEYVWRLAYASGLDRRIMARMIEATAGEPAHRLGLFMISVAGWFILRISRTT